METVQKAPPSPGEPRGNAAPAPWTPRRIFRKNCRKSQNAVDFFEKLYIIGASMIEARVSRVRIPKSRRGGGGKGRLPRFRPPGLGASEPGRGRRSRGLSPLRGGALSWIHTWCVCMKS